MAQRHWLEARGVDAEFCVTNLTDSFATVVPFAPSKAKAEETAKTNAKLLANKILVFIFLILK